MGLGHKWCEPLPSLRLYNQRAFANVVQLPEDDHAESALGRTIYAKTEEDGSGVVTVDLNDVYGPVAMSGSGKKQKLRKLVQYDKYGGGRHSNGLEEKAQIRGLRSIGVDYSGKSGAPCLIALVDKIDGGKKKVWTWRVASGQIDQKKGIVISEGDLKNCSVEGQVAKIVKPDGANLHLQFAAPAEVDLKAENRAITFKRTYNRGNADMPAPGFYASGKDPNDGHFFAVATIQKGKAPEIKVEGKGLDAVIRVGKQTVRFDGTKIIFGK